MNRLTSNKHILDMNNYELAHNCCYVSDGNARYRNKFEDIDCRDFIRELMIRYEVWKETNDEMTNDNIFDDTMTDYLQYTPARVRGLICLLYRNMWAMAELRETLKQYEDAEQHGLLLNPPCKIGDDIYFIPSKTNYDLNILNGHEESNRVYHQKVKRITFTERGWYIECNLDVEYGTGHVLVDKFYQETWFLSQKEAEQALTNRRV